MSNKPIFFIIILILAAGGIYFFSKDQKPITGEKIPKLSVLAPISSTSSTFNLIGPF